MYDPDRRPSRLDCGHICPGCRCNLFFMTAEPRRHWSGEGYAWECQRCGEPLHENEHGYVYPADPKRDLPPPVKLTGEPLVVRQEGDKWLVELS